jgi:hypothetical protein
MSADIPDANRASVTPADEEPGEARFLGCEGILHRIVYVLDSGFAPSQPTLLPHKTPIRRTHSAIESTGRIGFR